jgi:response regulator RpfG family c-di-GMP phosphodiesterase
MGQVQQKRRAVLIVEDDADLRSLSTALFEDEKVDTIECESAEAALAVMLIGGARGRHALRGPSASRCHGLS